MPSKTTMGYNRESSLLARSGAKVFKVVNGQNQHAGGVEQWYHVTKEIFFPSKNLDDFM